MQWVKYSDIGMQLHLPPSGLVGGKFANVTTFAQM